MPRINYLTTTDFDFGAISSLPKALSSLKISKPLVCTDKGIVAAGILDQVKEVVGAETAMAVYDGTPGNPTEEAVLEALEVFRDFGCDGLICLGGGSSMDLGKAVGILATHDGELAEFGPGGGKRYGKITPLIAVPTTSGTGSEVSVGAVIVLKDGRKMTFASPNLIPAYAICDPDLTLGLPKMLTAATGMDAVTHCIEAYLSAFANPVADAIGIDGLERAIKFGHLERAVADGSDKEARWHMMLASTEGALAFVKGLGAVHAMSHSVGRIKSLNLHHGTLNAVILPPILRFNESVCNDRYDRIRWAMGLEEGSDISAAIEELNGRIGLPANLSEMGVTKDMLPDLIKHAAMDLANATTPRKPTEADYEALFLELLPD
jgi:alcohol dehydrogenase class IV